MCTGQGLGRQPEAAIDNGNAGDVSPLRGESVFDHNVSLMYFAQERPTLDVHATLGEAHVGWSQIAGSAEFVASDVVLRNQHSPLAKLLGERHCDWPANGIEQHDLALAR